MPWGVPGSRTGGQSALQRYQSNGEDPFEDEEQPSVEEEAGTAPTQEFIPAYESELPPLPPRPIYHAYPPARERPAPPLSVATEAYQSEGEPPGPPRNRITFSIAKFNQFLKWLLSVLEVMFALRFFLSLLSTRNDNPFIFVLTSITDPLLAPFKTALVHDSTVQWYTLLAMLVYFLVIVALIRFLRIFVTEPEP